MKKKIITNKITHHTSNTYPRNPQSSIFKKYAGSLSFFMRFIDMAVMAFSGLIAFWIRFGQASISSYYLNAFLIAALLTALIFPRFDIYSSHRLENLLSILRRVILAAITVMLSLLLVSVIVKTTIIFSRAWMLTWTITAIISLCALRLITYLILRWLRRYGLNQKHIVIIGAGQMAEHLIMRLQQDAWAGFNIKCCLVDETSLESRSDIQGTPIKTMPKNLDAFIQTETIDEVWIALPLKNDDKIQAILDALRHNTVNIRLIPELNYAKLLNHSIINLWGISIINLRTSMMTGADYLLKWIEDKIFSAGIIILISPLLFIIALAIKFTSKGPILFKQKRHGWDGRIFTMYKFRTMKLHQEQIGQVTQATKHDSRLTSIGAFLRRTSLDELPQFLNVLKGDMSVVGPRPHAVVHNEQYKELILGYMQRHRMKPGLTGWAQVNGYRGETDTLDKMEKRVEYDLYYIENWSLWLDIKIIFMTLWKGFVNQNAY